jgi:ribonuclease T2
MKSLAVPALLLAGPAVAWASDAASGSFVAERPCEAFQSFRKQTNPGGARVAPGSEYRLREVNGPDRRWLRIEIPGLAEPRWVAAECGSTRGLQAAPSARLGAPREGGACNIAGQHDSYLLAMSWQPGFCEHVKYNGAKPECDHMADGRLVVSHVTLHGLWPNRKACGRRYGHCPGPALDLQPDTVAYIKPWMPNFFYEKAFGAYEWQKHGTCSAMDDDTYFRRAVDAVKTLDASAAGRYIAAHVGGKISRKVFYERVQADTGHALAGNAITLLCTNKHLFEVRVQLPLDFKTGGSLAQLLGTSLPPAREPDSKECRGDEILIEASGR